MIARVLIALLAVAGPTPLRICTCADHDEPLLAAAGEDHPDECDCPVFQPVAKQTAPPVNAPDASAFAFLLPPAESLDTPRAAAASPRFNRHSHPPAVPLHVTLRTWRN